MPARLEYGRRPVGGVWDNELAWWVCTDCLEQSATLVLRRTIGNGDLYARPGGAMTLLNAAMQAHNAERHADEPARPGPAAP